MILIRGYFLYEKLNIQFLPGKVILVIFICIQDYHLLSNAGEYIPQQETDIGNDKAYLLVAIAGTTIMVPFHSRQVTAPMKST